MPAKQKPVSMDDWALIVRNVDSQYCSSMFLHTPPSASSLVNLLDFDDLLLQMRDRRVLESSQHL